MKITYWSDFNCPYSYIGLKRLSDAVEELDIHVSWHVKSFELEPYAEKLNFNNMLELHLHKYKQNRDDALEDISEIENIASKSGLKINYKDTLVNSTKNAHRLVKYVQKTYPLKTQNLVFKIFKANFTYNKSITDIQTLTDIATSLGLDEQEVMQLLKGDRFKSDVEIDREDCIFSGIQTTPYYIIESEKEQLIMPGAFEKEDFKTALEDMLSGEIIQKTFL